MKHQPLVSVVMSVLNGQDYVRRAIDSILAQSFEDFELILVNDGSTDKTLSIMKSYKDERIIILDKKHQGLVPCLNDGISQARGVYIARHDADDSSMPERFAQQIDYLKAHPDCGAVTSFASLVDVDGNEKGIYEAPFLSADLKRRLYLGNTFVNGSSMIKRSLLETNPYVTTYGPTEDYALWTQLVSQTEFATIPQPLYRYQTHTGEITEFNSREDIKQTQNVNTALWDQKTFPASHWRELLKRGRYYKDYSRKHDSSVYNQYISDQIALSNVLIRHKYYRATWHTLIGLLALRPKSLLRAAQQMVKGK